MATHSRRFFNVLNSEQAPGARGELVGADFGGGCAAAGEIRGSSSSLLSAEFSNNKES